MPTRALLAAVAVSLAALAGCSEGGKSSTVPVSGTVTYKGQPVTDLKILLTPASGRPADGVLDSKGHFDSLTTDKPGDGAVPGKAKVSFSQKPATPASGAVSSVDTYAPPKPTGLPEKYNSSQTSDIEVTISDKGEKDLQIKLTE